MTWSPKIPGQNGGEVFTFRPELGKRDRAGGLATDDEVYRRGVAFLLKTQKEDGSWLVTSRSKPFQLYYESGFPHGNDQFISMAATGWAVTALSCGQPSH